MSLSQSSPRGNMDTKINSIGLEGQLLWYDFFGDFSINKASLQHVAQSVFNVQSALLIVQPMLFMKRQFN